MPFTTGDLGACCCPCTLTVLGCFGLPLVGATVTAYGAGGAVLAVATSDGNGHAALGVAAEGATNFTVTRPRFLPSSAQENPCGQAVNLLPDGTHVCFDNCAIPLATTVQAHVTGLQGEPGPVDGPLTFFGDTLQWVGTLGTYGSFAGILGVGGGGWLYSVYGNCYPAQEVVVCGDPPTYTATGDCPGIWQGTMEIHE